MIWIVMFILLAFSPAKAHDQYNGILNFDKVNCCNGQDCKKAYDQNDFIPIKNGYRLRSTGEVVMIPTTGFSPDAFWHICRRTDKEKTIRCLLIPPGGM